MWIIHNNPIHISFLLHMFFVLYSLVLYACVAFSETHLTSAWLTLLWGLFTLTKLPIVLLLECKLVLPQNSSYVSYCATFILNSATACYSISSISGLINLKFLPQTWIFSHTLIQMSFWARLWVIFSYGTQEISGKKTHCWKRCFSAQVKYNYSFFWRVSHQFEHRPCPKVAIVILCRQHSWSLSQLAYIW